MKRRLCLASQSPRRAELLRQAGFDFSIFAPQVDESAQPGESPHALVERLSVLKAQAAITDIPGEAAVCLAADTIVLLGSRVLGKPGNAIRSAQMLSGLSGRSHQVLTAVTVTFAQQLHSLVVTSTVTFRQLSEDTIRDYCATGEPFDKAGAYAIQGLGGVFVQSLSGSYSAVMGLPLCETAELLGRAGLRPHWPRHENEQ